MMTEAVTEAFKAACTQLARVVVRQHGGLERLAWRHHGLGMLQAELSHSLRMHIWHPSLSTIPDGDFRRVHDHRFTLTSFVIVGAIDDEPWLVRQHGGHEGSNAEMFEIVHAKEQERVADIARSLGPVYARPWTRRMYLGGDVYTIKRRAFHTTSVEGLAITMVARTDFDGDHARVLGHGSSAIVPLDEQTGTLRREILREASYRLASV